MINNEPVRSAVIEVTYIAKKLDNKYVLAGLTIAEEAGDVTITVQPAVFGSVESAIVSCKGRNITIVPTEYISADEHADRLMAVIEQERRER